MQVHSVTAELIFSAIKLWRWVYLALLKAILFIIKETKIFNANMGIILLSRPVGIIIFIRQAED
jgi:hypothetical protein